VSLGQLSLGLILGSVIGGLAYVFGSLTLKGASAATLVGAVTFGFGGLLPAVLLVLFFLSSSALSHVGVRHKRALLDMFAKGGRRDHGQVLANGSLAAISAMMYALRGEMLWLVSLIGALAAVTADTWATELGVLAHRRPRLITTGRVVDAGTSGGVTLEGTLATAGGAGLIGLAAALLLNRWMIVLIALTGGMVGAFFDSLLGATVQAIYRCPSCSRETERHPLHTCGHGTQLLRGWSWLSNDMVNFIASLVGAVTALICWNLL
jgi:uncharacterized protein (TIGR00297 family)